MNSHLKQITLGTFAVIAALFLACINGNSPFSDSSNAGIYIDYQTIHDRDTSFLFSSETLTVIVTVKEQVDSFSLSCNKNRLWPSGDTVVKKNGFNAEPFVFAISFYDTGWQSILLKAFRSNATTKSETLSTYVSSPLHQDTVRGYFGQPLTLQTRAVKDHDIYYYWSFGAGTLVSAVTSRFTASINNASLLQKGELWVDDGVFKSPEVPFVFFLNDTTRPDISCVNQGFEGKDTVYTADNSFTFSVSITDRIDGAVDSASVNGQRFDQRDNNIYFKLFSGVMQHPAGQPVEIDIYALDQFQYGNENRKKFYLIYSPTAPHASRLRLSLTAPAHDSTRTSLQRFGVMGTLEALRAETLGVSFSVRVNDSTTLQFISVDNNGATPWNQAVTLVDGDNPVTITALERSTGDTLASVKRTIVYISGQPDSVPPVILDILVGVLPADGYYSKDAAVLLRVNAFDDGSGIEKVTINNSVAQRSTNPAWYQDTVKLLHSLAGNELTIEAVDLWNNNAQKTVTMFFNRIPVFTQLPSPAYLLTDSLYRDSVGAIDPDGDNIVFSKKEGPAGITVSPNGQISWLPTIADIGTQQIVLQAWDGYQPAFATYQVNVAAKSSPPTPLRLLTSNKDFPRTLEVGRDSLALTLRTVPGSGVGPYRFTARIIGKNYLLLNDTTYAALTWKPAIADTGLCQFVVVVRDNIAQRDTLYASTLVIPVNRPCSLSVSCKSPTKTGGVIDLNKLHRSDTLTYHIFDPDNPLYDKHSIFIYQARGKTTSVIDSATSDSFRLALDPSAFDGMDTIITTVKDHDGLAYTLNSIVNYGSPPNAPQLRAPVNDTTNVTSTVTFSWHGSDPDNDSLYYEFFTGLAPESLTVSTLVLDTTTTIPAFLPHTTFYWKVRAWDWKSVSAYSPVWTFTTK